MNNDKPYKHTPLTLHTKKITTESQHKLIFNFLSALKRSLAIILVLSVFFDAIIRLTNFSSDDFDFSSSKTGYTGSAQWALIAL